MSAVREAIDEALDRWSDIDPHGLDRQRVVDELVRAVEAVPVVPVIEGNGSMDGVTPILFFEAGSTATRELRAALTWSNVLHFRITIDDGLLKWKVSEGPWWHGSPTERPNGGNG